MIIIILVRVLRFSLRFSGGMSLDITYNYYPYLAMNEKLPIFFLLISNQIMSELLFCNIIYYKIIDGKVIFFSNRTSKKL